MTPTAILFLVLAALLVWGGLVVSILLLRRDSRADQGDGPGEGDGYDDEHVEGQVGTPDIPAVGWTGDSVTGEDPPPRGTTYGRH